MTKQEKEFLVIRSKHNKRVIAKYLALYTENMHLNKCLVTLTPSDSKLTTTLDLRRNFIKKLNRYKHNIKNGDLTIKYFSNIEFTKNCVSHLHIQLFYTNIIPIKKAYSAMVNHLIGNTSQNSLSVADNHRLIFNYIIKDYMNTDLALEKFKYTRSIKYISSSQKTLSNNIVKYLINVLIFTSKNKYKQILNLISNNKIKIIKRHIRKIKKYTLTNRIGKYTVVIYKRSEKSTYKSKRLIKNKSSKKGKFLFEYLPLKEKYR